MSVLYLHTPKSTPFHFDWLALSLSLSLAPGRHGNRREEEKRSFMRAISLQDFSPSIHIFVAALTVEMRQRLVKVTKRESGNKPRGNNRQNPVPGNMFFGVFLVSATVPDCASGRVGSG